MRVKCALCVASAKVSSSTTGTSSDHGQNPSCWPCASDSLGCPPVGGRHLEEAGSAIPKLGSPWPRAERGQGSREAQWPGPGPGCGLPPGIGHSPALSVRGSVLQPEVCRSL